MIVNADENVDSQTFVNKDRVSVESMYFKCIVRINGIGILQFICHAVPSV